MSIFSRKPARKAPAAETVTVNPDDFRPHAAQVQWHWMNAASTRYTFPNRWEAEKFARDTERRIPDARVYVAMTF